MFLIESDHRVFWSRTNKRKALAKTSAIESGGESLGAYGSYKV